MGLFVLKCTVRKGQQLWQGRDKPAPAPAPAPGCLLGASHDGGVRILALLSDVEPGLGPGCQAQPSSMWAGGACRLHGLGPAAGFTPQAGATLVMGLLRRLAVGHGTVVMRRGGEGAVAASWP